jgi:polysaccharide export outer membrane protein
MTALELVAIGGGLRRAQFTSESGTLQLIQTEQDYADLKLQQFALQVRQARILAEMAETEFSYALPEHDGVLNRQAMQQVVDVENTLFRTRRDVLSNQEKALMAQRASYDPEIAALDQSIKLYDEEMGLIAQDVAAMKTLADQKLTAQSRLREVQRGYSAAQRDELEQRSFLARARQNQLDIDQRIVELHSKQANENASDLRDLNLELSRDEQKSASLLATLSELKRQADSSATAVMTMTTSYTITRLVDGRHEQVAADEQTAIEPGDILRIEQKLTAGGVRLSLK